MSRSLNNALQLIEAHKDSLVPMDTVKACIKLLSESQENHNAHINLLRSQISIWGSDDTQMFSRQLTGSALINELKTL